MRVLVSLSGVVWGVQAVVCSCPRSCSDVFATCKRVRAVGFPPCSQCLPSPANYLLCSWAFASAAMGEASSYINTGNIVSLSEKQLVDCDTSNNGCNGGW